MDYLGLAKFLSLSLIPVLLIGILVYILKNNKK